MERSRQILKKIEDCERTTIDDTNHTIILDQQDTEISVVEFLSALQVNTKQLPKKFLTLVGVLRLPQFLLANTYARHTSSQNQHQIRLAAGASPYKKQKLPNRVRQHLISGSQIFENEKQEVVLWIMQKSLGKGSKKTPSLWCHVCGWIHFKCSGLTDSKDYHDNFLCSHCRERRVLLDGEKDGDYAAVFPKIHDHYTNPRKESAFGADEA